MAAVKGANSITTATKKVDSNFACLIARHALIIAQLESILYELYHDTLSQKARLDHDQWTDFLMRRRFHHHSEPATRDGIENSIMDRLR
jgi:hypothetical protein